MTSTSNSARAGVVTALAVVLLGLVGCGVPSSGGADPLPSDLAAIATPTPTPTPTEKESTSTPDTTPVRLVWVHNNKLVPTPSSVAGNQRDEVLGAVLSSLVAGPSEAAVNRGLNSLIPPDARLTGNVGGHSASVGLAFTSQPSADTTLLVGQVALTALSVPHVQRVRFLVEGKVVRVPVPHGRHPQVWVSARDYRTVVKDSARH